MSFIEGVTPGPDIERYKLQEWLSFISYELHKRVGSMFNSAPEWKATVNATLSERPDWLSKISRANIWWTTCSASLTATCLP